MKSARSYIKLALFSFVIVFLFFASSNTTRAADEKIQNETSSYLLRTEVGDGNQSNFLNTNPDVPQDIHSTMQVLMLETLSSLACQLSGVNPTSPDGKCLGVDPETGKIGFVENGGGLLAVTGKLIDYTFVPPASSMQYVAYLRNNFGIVKSANAQAVNPCAQDDAPRGVGFCGLEPILPIWVTMRNIVYLILILAFVIIGLGIMLRIHIDPRTVMTLQNQIPKIIIAIVGITFSFAIAGLLIDVMWVTIYLFAGVLTSATAGAYDVTNTQMLDLVRAGTPFDAVNGLFNFSQVSGEDVFFDTGILGIAEITSKAFGGIVQSVFEGRKDGGPLFDLIGGSATVLAFIVIVIAIIAALMRLWMSLILSYLNIILDVIFAPFFILAGVFPGSKMGLGGWIRDLLANLAVFPVAIAFFILANYLMQAYADSERGITNKFIPPLMGGANSDAIAALIGFGFILMLPNLMGVVKEVFKAPKLDFKNIMGPVGAGTAFPGAIGKRAFGLGESYRYYTGRGQRFDTFFNAFGNKLTPRGGGKAHSGAARNEILKLEAAEVAERKKRVGMP